MVLRAQVWGQKAQRLLTRPGFAATVLGRTAQMLVLQSTQGELIWVGTIDTPPHARAVLLHDVLPPWNPGTFCASTGCFLFGEGRLGLSFHQAQLWTPLPLVLYRPPPSVAQRAQQLAQAFPFPSTHWVHALQQVSMARDLRELLSWGARLVGLGPGLTPMGDDFVGGALFGARLASRCLTPWVWDESWLEEFLDQAKERTTTLSAALLADLAHGDGPAPLHSLAHALLDHSPFEVVLTAAHTLTRIGHSSGLACLAGFYTVLSSPPAWEEREGGIV